MSDAATPQDVRFDRVDVRDVTRQFGRRRALRRVSLTLEASRIIGLFGPNGAGKSTLLSILATLLRPSSGDVHYGTQTRDEGGDELRKHIGVLGHDLFLYGDLTARENLEFFARLSGAGDVVARVSQALALSRLEDRADDRVAGFSRGLRQRLALERALIHAPTLVLLDEPFTGLDDASTEALRLRLRAVREAGAIVVITTHDFESVDGLTDDAWCLDEGRLYSLAGDGPLRARYRRALADAARART